MKLSLTFVPVRKIKPGLSRWNFSDEAVEQAAHLVAKLEGLINPLVLRQETNSQAYEVLDGNFEYYVAARASELDPRTCETIAAFIIEPEDEALICEQIDWFRHRRQPGESGQIITAQPATDLESRLGQLERRQSDLESRQLWLEMQTIKPIQQQLQAMEGIPGASPNPRGNLLGAFNDLEAAALLQQMRRAGLTGRNAEKIVETIEQERQQQRFRSLKDVVMRVKGLTYEKMVDLLEAS